jgi:hypothetical protein
LFQRHVFPFYLFVPGPYFPFLLLSLGHVSVLYFLTRDHDSLMRAMLFLSFRCRWVTLPSSLYCPGTTFPNSLYCFEALFPCLFCCLFCWPQSPVSPLI